MQAIKGGQYGVNGEWYNGGEFLHDCTSKDKHPQAAIYSNAFGGWVGDYNLIKIGDNLYRMK